LIFSFVIVFQLIVRNEGIFNCQLLILLSVSVYWYADVAHLKKDTKKGFL